jgi:hypothetical protein
VQLKGRQGTYWSRPYGREGVLTTYFGTISTAVAALQNADTGRKTKIGTGAEIGKVPVSGINPSRSTNAL